MHVLAEGDTIVRVSRTEIPVTPDMAVYDVGGRLLVPGFVDAHTHLAQSFGRGIYDNLHMTQWLVAMSHNFNLTPEQVYVASLIGCIEAIKLMFTGENGSIAIPVWIWVTGGLVTGSGLLGHASNDYDIFLMVLC